MASHALLQNTSTGFFHGLMFVNFVKKHISTTLVANGRESSPQGLHKISEKPRVEKFRPGAFEVWFRFPEAD